MYRPFWPPLASFFHPPLLPKPKPPPQPPHHNMQKKGSIKHVIDVSAYDNDDDDDDDDDDTITSLLAKQHQRKDSGLSRKEEAIYKMYLGSHKDEQMASDQLDSSREKKNVIPRRRMGDKRMYKMKKRGEDSLTFFT